MSELSDLAQLAQRVGKVIEDGRPIFERMWDRAVGEGRGATPAASAPQQNEAGRLWAAHLLHAHAVPENWIKGRSAAWYEGFHTALVYEGDGSDSDCTWRPGDPPPKPKVTCAQCSREIFNDQTVTDAAPVWLTTRWDTAPTMEAFACGKYDGSNSRYHVPAE